MEEFIINIKALGIALFMIFSVIIVIGVIGWILRKL
jgi:hypothetical protein